MNTRQNIGKIWVNFNDQYRSMARCTEVLVGILNDRNKKVNVFDDFVSLNCQRGFILSNKGIIIIPRRHSSFTMSS